MKLMLVLIVALAAQAGAAPLSDLKGSPQARDAVAVLAAKGILHGYPGGVYKGDRAISRNETAELLNRLELYMETLEGPTASKAELKTVEGSLEALRKGKDELNVRVGGMEDEVQTMEKRLP